MAYTTNNIKKKLIFFFIDQVSQYVKKKYNKWKLRCGNTADFLSQNILNNYVYLFKLQLLIYPMWI